MFGIGTGELLLILVIALLVLGPERMPKVARDIGRVVGDLRRTSDELREEFLNADKVLERAVDVTAKQDAAPALQAAAQATDTAPDPAAIPGETAFDREMREARERLRAQRDGS
ncbi:MAG TPA: Sec-independent protein translocase protein TatB [Candidatus Limnocylindria bacterium]|jgi:sec-independent protein translocase protein TatB|nr:Sec-independent protein translocase protein TatB [Candidatus Limnocylindria bacterium]